jgi:sugar/nucleoside kinase (ribokinase family)
MDALHTLTNQIHRRRQYVLSINLHSQSRCVENSSFILITQRIIDTTGAGDAFIGGFLVEWIRSGRDMNSSLLAGCLSGACAVQLIGGSTVPANEMLTRVEKQKE